MLERQIRDLERDRKNAEKQVREAAKRGDIRSAKMLAKEIVHTKKVCKALALCLNFYILAAIFPMVCILTIGGRVSCA